MRSRGQAMRLGALAVTVAALGAAVAASGGGAAGTSTLVLTPVADSFVRADRPARTFGKAASLVVARRPLSVAFLRFRVVVPSGEAVVRATLELFVSGAGSGF
ncbi:MAG TPA: hypothetical protein VFB42_00005, partial [Gaiellaceae bacterium]|nr:hypothetical protein [Gaiellaceae bacterium]